ncbi:hypothetical protein MTsPCn9_02670 [Croceitalea sp. MTPC9]|uniref:2TM domain-containing protein n=1 Tax=unclassified Croceitalea TaxID=2632280 RepID=UPI002B385483|nr:hypothetical protein MTsPCn6_06040 [Croceitalea sp. MTPC6]GMN15331.1 hypothetical protein MTsPCn9_02670 [Croceitalea sp. MTPC9]
MINEFVNSDLARAQKRVEVLKNFYKHLTTYILINSFLLLFAKSFTIVLLSKQALGNPEFLEWVNWNFYGTPIIWGIALLIHAVYVFLPSPFKKWEEKQIKKYLEKDKEETEKYR